MKMIRKAGRETNRIKVTKHRWVVKTFLKRHSLLYRSPT